jgi:hypothetical protein
LSYFSKKASLHGQHRGRAFFQRLIYCMYASLWNWTNTRRSIN